MRAVLLACAVLAMAGEARADDDVPAPPPAEPAEPTPPPEPEPPPVPPPTTESLDRPLLKAPIDRREIVINVPGERKRETKIVLASLTAAGALVGAVGLYFHLDSRTAADSVSAQKFTGRPWSPADDAAIEQADRARTKAAIFYGIGGAFVTAAIVALIITDPKSERRVIRPHAPGVTPSVSLAPGGALLGGTLTW